MLSPVKPDQKKRRYSKSRAAKCQLANRPRAGYPNLARKGQRYRPPAPRLHFKFFARTRATPELQTQAKLAMLAAPDRLPRAGRPRRQHVFLGCGSEVPAGTCPGRAGSEPFSIFTTRTLSLRSVRVQSGIITGADPG